MTPNHSDAATALAAYIRTTDSLIEGLRDALRKEQGENPYNRQLETRNWADWWVGYHDAEAGQRTTARSQAYVQGFSAFRSDNA